MSKPVTVAQDPHVASPFIRLQLNQCFPSSLDEYRKMREKAAVDPKYKDKVAPYTLHYLFSSNATQTITTYFRGKTEEFIREGINKPDPEHGMTCLHITVVQEDIDGSRVLLQRGALIDAKDKYGFSPWLLTAFLTNYTAIKQLLEQHNATKEEDKWQQLRRNAGFSPSHDSLSQSYYRNEVGKLVALDQESSKNRLGLEGFTDDVFFHPDEHLLLWQNYHAELRSKDNADAKGIKINALLRERTIQYPPLYVQTVLQSPVEGTTQPPRGLFCLETLEQGAFVGWYGSKAKKKVLPLQERKGNPRILEAVEASMCYHCHFSDIFHIDAYLYGNLLRFANDGWPNIVGHTFPGKGCGLFCIEAAKPDTELTWDYGADVKSVKWGKYQLKRKEEIVNFFKKGDLKALWNSMAEIQARQMKTQIESSEYRSLFFHCKNLEAKIEYIYTTPAALIYLCLNKTLPPQEFIDLLLINFVHEVFLKISDHRPHYTWIVQILSLLEIFDACLKNLKKEKAEKIRHFLINEVMDFYKVTQIVQFIYRISEYLKENSDVQIDKSWTSFKEELKQELKDFNWENDKNHVLYHYVGDKGYIVPRGNFAKIFTQLFSNHM